MGRSREKVSQSQNENDQTPDGSAETIFSPYHSLSELFISQKQKSVNDNDNNNNATIQQAGTESLSKIPRNLFKFGEWLTISRKGKDNRLVLGGVLKKEIENANQRVEQYELLQSIHESMKTLDPNDSTKSSKKIAKMVSHVKKIQKSTLLAIDKLDKELTTHTDTFRLPCKPVEIISDEPKPTQRITKDLFALELAQMIVQKEDELRLERKSFFYSAKMFFAKVVHYKETGEQKLDVMKRMFNLVINKHQAKKSFSDDDLVALKGSRLGILIDRYRDTRALPKEFIDAESASKQRVQQKREKAPDLIVYRPRF